MDYRNMSPQELNNALQFAIANGNANAALEIRQFQDYYGERVVVFKGRKCPIGTQGYVFWLKRYNYGKYGDPYGIYGYTKVGIKDNEGNTFFTDIKNVSVIKD